MSAVQRDAFSSNACRRGAARNLAALRAELDDKNGVLQSLRRSLADSDEKLARRSQQCRQLMDIVSVGARSHEPQLGEWSLICAASNTVVGAGKAHELHRRTFEASGR